VEENRLNEDSASPRTRHICVVSETYHPEINGVTLTLGHLVNGLRQRGHEVSIVRPRQACDAGAENDVTLVKGLPLPGYRGLQFGLPADGTLKALWARRRPDVIYVATEGPLGWSAVSVARRLSIPAFSGFHTNFHSYSRHYRIGWLASFGFTYLRWFHNRSQGTFVPSPDLRELLVARGFRNVGCVGRGVDSDLFNPARRSDELRRHWGIGGDQPVIAYIGRLAGEKNLGLAIEAYRAIRQSHPSLRFVMVGDGPMRPSLEAEHRDIIFSGLQKGEQLATHYASADIFLFPSETETFGNVVLEGMASGLGVVAYDYAAARSHIINGETGVLAPFGDAKAFVAAAIQLVGQASTLQKIRRQAREYSASIGWSQVVERFEALLSLDSDRYQSAIKPMVRRGNLAAAARGRV
jgi:glycosyltransferase involved in cell wall biosynthesis